jgi:hypothetical protein
MEAFKGKTCFEILHEEEGLELWKRTGNREKPTHLTRGGPCDLSITERTPWPHSQNNKEKKVATSG